VFLPSHALYASCCPPNPDGTCYSCGLHWIWKLLFFEDKAVWFLLGIVDIGGWSSKVLQQHVVPTLFLPGVHIIFREESFLGLPSLYGLCCNSSFFSLNSIQHLHRVPVGQVGVGGAPLKTNTAGSFLFKCFWALIFCLSVFHYIFSVARFSSEVVVQLTLQIDPFFMFDT
jgi:hypothetical protein